MLLRLASGNPLFSHHFIYEDIMITAKLHTLFPLSALVLLSACMSPPKDLDRSLTRPTAKGQYVATIRSLATPVPMNKIHSWEVRVSQASGQPVTGARITVDGGMPQHRHGLPTKPRVTRELDDGRYLIEGMKFSMDGWWEIKLGIAGPQGTDQVTYNLVLPVQR